MHSQPERSASTWRWPPPRIREERGGKVFLDSTRSGGATVAAAYSPRVRPGVPVSFPVRWDDLDSVKPADFTIHMAADLLGGKNVWREQLPPPQRLPADLIDEGRTIPIARVVAMHEGKGGPAKCARRRTLPRLTRDRRWVRAEACADPRIVLPRSRSCGAPRPI